MNNKGIVKIVSVILAIALFVGSIVVMAAPFSVPPAPAVSSVTSDTVSVNESEDSEVKAPVNLSPPLSEPDIWVEPDSFNVTLHRGDVAEENLTIGNNGTALLEFEIRDRAGAPLSTISPLHSSLSSKISFKANNGEPLLRAEPDANEICPGGVNESSVAPLNFTDIHFVYDVEGPSGDNQCLGVEFNGTHFFVTGGNRGSDPNKVYIFDRDGNYISSFNQVYSSGWGWRDLAWDGTYLYGSDDSYVSQFLPNGTYIDDFPGPGISPCRALAYDPATDHFWTASWNSPIYEFDRSGTIINTYSNTYSIYGMAWDDASCDGPWLWVFAQEGSPAVTAYQFDPVNGVYTGVSFTGWGNPRDFAGGVCFTTEWDPRFGILVGLTQNVPDSIVGYEICLMDAPWLTEYPTEGNVTPSNQTNITVTFNATELEEGEYNATIIIESNDTDESPLNIPVNLTVIPPEHDIAVTNLSAPDEVEVNTTIDVNGTICNLGLNDETDVVVDFIVNGSIEDNKTVSIASGNCTNVSFNWTAPGVEGEHNLTIYAEPVINETIVGNNMMSQNISVITIADIWVEPESYEFTVKRGDTECENLTIGNNGTGMLIFNITTQAGAPAPITYPIPITYKDKQIIIKQEFSKPEIDKIKMDKGEYDRVAIPGLPKIVKAGEPVLPVKNLQILLPFGKDVQSIEVVGEKRDLAGTYYVEPGEEPVPIGVPMKEPPKIVPNKTIYSSTKPYPDKLYEASVQSLRGYKILNLNLYPVQYTPKPGTIAHYTEMKITVNTKPGSNNLYRGLQEDKERVLQVVDNPEIADTYPLDTKFSPSYDHVIITNSSFATAFQRLADWKSRKGVRSHVVTVEYINSTYPGRDLQEKIRNYINYSYLNDGIEYVLLGGDGDGSPVGGETGPAVVPARGFYAYAAGYTDYNIPADLYYAGLDGTWNDDNDTRWGEPGEDDLYAEVYVGRAAVDSLGEVENFINKTIAYESTPAGDPYLKNATMLGEYLRWAVWGKDYKEEIRNGTCNWGYCTVGFPPEYNVSTLYDRDYPGYNWPNSLLIAIMNSGTQLIFNHLGHANVGYVMKMYNADVDALVNDKYFFGYSQGCYDGSFDNRRTSPGSYTTYDCICEHFTLTPHGAFAFIGNSRYGWGSYYTTNGPSQHYDRQFYDAIFNESMGNIGKANQDSKEDNVWQIGGSAMRWCYYEINLFGDPETSLIPTAVPWLSVTPDNGTVGVGNDTNVSVCVNATYLEEGTYNASIIIANNDPDENPVTIPVNLTVIPPDHDISVTNLSAPSEVEVNTNISVNATVCNRGSNDETGIVVDFIVDGVTEDNTTINLTSGNCTNVSFNWTAPGVEGAHNLTVYAEPVINETIVDNNMMSQNISVITIADIWVEPAEFNVTLHRGDVAEENLTIGNNGTGVLEFEIADTVTGVFFADDMESGVGGWTHGGAQDEWELGTPTYGPPGAHSGANCWGTDLDSTYNNYANEWLMSQAIDLSGARNVNLSFYRWYQTESCCDRGYVEISTDNGATWTILKTYRGSGTTWTQENINISAYTGPNVRIRFRLHSDFSITYAGLYIDDVVISGEGVFDWLTEYPTEGNVTPSNHTNITVTFNATELEEGEYNATIIIESNDPDESPLNIPVNLTVIPPEHDIAVTNLSAPEEVEANTTIAINGTICNLGLNDETDVVIDFIVDSIIEDNTTINLTSGNCTNVSFNWTAPGVEGEHNLTVYAEPVAGETIVDDNMMSQNVSVIGIADIWVYPEEFNVTLEKGDKVNKTLTIGNNGTTGELNAFLSAPDTDVDQDGELEIIVRPHYGYTYIVNNSNLDTTSGWEWRSPYTDSYKGFAIADVNGNGTPNLLEGGYHYLRVYDVKRDITLYSNLFTGGSYGGTCAGDIDNDGITEMLVSDYNGYIYVYDGTTGMPDAQGHITTPIAFYGTGLGIGDIDNDGVVEVVRADYSGIDIFNGETRALEGSISRYFYSYPDLVFGDADGDGIAEIYTGGYGYVYAYEWNGTSATYLWQSPDLGSYARPSGFADADNDGDYEVFVGNSNGYLYALNASTGSIEGSVDTGSGWTACAIGDIDQDGISEIAVGNYDGRIRTYTYDSGTFTLEKTSVTDYGSYLGRYTDSIIISGARDPRVFNLINYIQFSENAVSVPPGSYHNVTVTFNATNLNKGTYNANIVIDNNDPDENPVLIPVNLTVITPPHIISFSPTDLTPTQYINTTNTFSVTTDQVMTSNTWFVSPIGATTTGNGTSSLTVTWDSAGSYNVTYVGSNENGSVNITWTVTVTGTGGVATAVHPKVSSVTTTGGIAPLGTAVNLSVVIVSSENFDDVFRVHLTTEGIPPHYKASLDWFNWTFKEIAIPAKGEATIPLQADIPANVSGVKAFKVVVDSTKWTSKTFDMGIFEIT